MADEQTVDPVDTTATSTGVDTQVATEPTEKVASENTTEGTPAEEQQGTVDPLDTEEPAVKPDDWATARARIAKGDEKIEKRLARYTSIDSVAEALIAAQDKIRDGSLKSALPKDATPEQLAAWRSENGVPDKPEEYDTTLPDGLVIGDADKPIVDAYLVEAHKSNLTPDQVKANLAWYFAQQEEQIAQQYAADESVRETAEEALREVWGTETKLNKSLIKGMLETAPKGVADQLLGARLSDGTPLGSHPDTLRWLADVARTLNPMATVVPNSGTNQMQAIEAELAGFEAKMKDKASDYWKGPTAAANQQRYRDLLNVQARVK